MTDPEIEITILDEYLKKKENKVEEIASRLNVKESIVRNVIDIYLCNLNIREISKIEVEFEEIKPSKSEDDTKEK